MLIRLGVHLNQLWVRNLRTTLSRDTAAQILGELLDHWLYPGVCADLLQRKIFEVLAEIHEHSHAGVEVVLVLLLLR